jgi:hypothetical protein
MIIWHSGRVVPRPYFAFHQRKATALKQADVRDMFRKASKSVCASVTGVSPDPLYPTPATSSAMKTPENTERGPYDPELADGGDIQMECSSPESCSPSIGIVTKKLPGISRSVQVLPDNLEYPIIWHLSSPMDAGLMKFY